MNKLTTYRFILIIAFTMLLYSCNQKRDKDIDELVLSEYVFEKDGIYYKGDCEIHAKEKFTGNCKFFHDNGKLKGFVIIKNGLPNGQWKYWDKTGVNTLNVYFLSGKLIKKEKPVCEENYSWTKNLTKNSIDAILKSIDNIVADSDYQGNFPTDIYNMPFVREDKTDFVIVGYETSSDTPENLKINFHPKNEYMSGPRFTVEVNIITEQAKRVYMTPDA